MALFAAGALARDDPVSIDVDLPDTLFRGEVFEIVISSSDPGIPDLTAVVPSLDFAELVNTWSTSSSSFVRDDVLPRGCLVVRR